MTTPITNWGPEHAEQLKEWGTPAIKRPNPVYLFKPPVGGIVRTNEGALNLNEGDYVAHDPISGHVWPVAADYVAQHYDFQEQ